MNNDSTLTISPSTQTSTASTAPTAPIAQVTLALAAPAPVGPASIPVPLAPTIADAVIEAAAVPAAPAAMAPAPAGAAPAAIAAAPAAPTPAGTDDQAFARLARLTPADYDRVRLKEARRLGIRPRTLDTEVGKFRADLEDDIQANSVKLKEFEPWPGPILDAPELFYQVCSRYELYTSMPAGGPNAITLWTGQAHVFQAFYIIPRLNLVSIKEGCGKSTTIDLLATMVPRPFTSSNIKPAVIYRITDRQAPTFVLDEADTYIHLNSDLRGLLNAGHKRGAFVARCQGKDVHGFRCFAPAAIASIGHLPATLRDRSILITMAEAQPGKVHARFDNENTDTEKELGRKLARWAKDNFDAVRACDPPMPPGAYNRIADNWRPLFAVAQVVGGDWPARALEAFNQLASTRRNLPAQNLQPLNLDPKQLLGDIRLIFTAAGVTRMFSNDLVTALLALPDRPYAQVKDLDGQTRLMDQPMLGRILRSFGIQSTNVRIANHQAKGYDLADFTDSFPQFLDGN
jgi:putative DNA primase/helicase